MLVDPFVTEGKNVGPCPQFVWKLTTTAAPLLLTSRQLVDWLPCQPFFFPLPFLPSLLFPCFSRVPFFSLFMPLFLLFYSCLPAADGAFLSAAAKASTVLERATPVFGYRMPTGGWLRFSLGSIDLCFLRRLGKVLTVA